MTPIIVMQFYVVINVILQIEVWQSQIVITIIFCYCESRVAISDFHYSIICYYERSVAISNFPSAVFVIANALKQSQLFISQLLSLSGWTFTNTIRDSLYHNLVLGSTHHPQFSLIPEPPYPYEEKDQRKPQ